MVGVTDSKLQMWMQRSRGLRDLSQEEFGRATGWSQAAIQAWETGVRGLSRRAYQSMVDWAQRAGAEPPPEVDWGAIPQKRRGAADVKKRYLARNVRQLTQAGQPGGNPALAEVRARVEEADPLLAECWDARRESGAAGGPLIAYRSDFASERLVASLVALPDDPAQVVMVRRGNRERLWDLLRMRELAGAEQAVLIYLLLGGAALLESVQRVVASLNHETQQHGIQVMLFTSTREAADYIADNA